MLNHYTTKMTGPLVTWIIHLSFLYFYIVIQGIYSFLYCQNPYFHAKCHFTKIQSNIAIWQYIAIYSNTICNMALTRIVSPLAPIYFRALNPWVNLGPGVYMNPAFIRINTVHKLCQVHTQLPNPSWMQSGSC